MIPPRSIPGGLPSIPPRKVQARMTRMTLQVYFLASFICLLSETEHSSFMKSSTAMELWSQCLEASPPCMLAPSSCLWECTLFELHWRTSSCTGNLASDWEWSLMVFTLSLSGQRSSSIPLAQTGPLPGQRRTENNNLEHLLPFASFIPPSYCSHPSMLA